MPWESSVSGGGCGRILRKSDSFHQSDFRQRCETCSLFHVYAPASWAFPSKTCLQGKKIRNSLWSEITVSFSAFFLGDLYFIRRENVSLFLFFKGGWVLQLVLVMTFGDATLVLLIEFATSLFILPNLLRVDGSITVSRILPPSLSLESKSSNLKQLYALGVWQMTASRARWSSFTDWGDVLGGARDDHIGRALKCQLMPLMRMSLGFIRYLISRER